MTKVAKLKTRDRWNNARGDYDGLGPCVVYVGPEHGVWLECELEHPPSSAGQRLVLRIDPDLVDSVLKILRDNAIERRRTPMAP